VIIVVVIVVFNIGSKKSIISKNINYKYILSSLLSEYYGYLIKVNILKSENFELDFENSELTIYSKNEELNNEEFVNILEYISKNDIKIYNNLVTILTEKGLL
jgi:hypothetical protein